MAYNTTLYNCSVSDDALRPVIINACRSGFDFTLMFEQTILSILPSALLLLLMPFRLFVLYGENIKTIRDVRYGAKAAAVAVFAAVQMSLLILWATYDNIRTPASVPAAALSFVNAIALGQLSYLEHTRSLQPSTLITTYLLLSLLFDAAQARTLYLRTDSNVLAAVLTATIALKLTVLVLEAQNKRSSLRQPYRSYAREALSGIFNRSIFWWLKPLFVGGFSKVLTLDDLGSIDESLSSEPLRDRIQTIWDKRKQPEGEHSLTIACIKTLKWPILSTVFPRLCLIAFNYSQTFLISRLISFVGDPSTAQNKNDGYGLIAAGALIYTGIALSTVHFKHRLYRTITMFRGAAVGLIYNKTMKLQDGVYNESAAVTLMSTDIDRVASSMVSVHEIWAQLIEVIIGIWLLARQVGWVSVIPVVLIILCSIGTQRVSRNFGSAQRIWTAATQKRIAMTSSILGSMKSAKIMGLAGAMTESIQGQRETEVGLSRRYRWIAVLIYTIGSIPTNCGPVLTFIAFAIQARVRHQDTLSTNQAFTSLAILSLVTAPVEALLIAAPLVAAGNGCMQRIQIFLRAASWDDTRLLFQETPSMSSQTPMDNIEMENIGGKESNSVALSIKNLTLRYSPTLEPALKDINTELKRGSLTMLVGPIGSGKSSFMKAILGELPYQSGTISVSSKNVAYCAQTSWMLNISIRQIICGLIENTPIDENWYRAVLHACALNEDLQHFPEGDESVIGSRGLVLSGGQKQRVALARAVYAKRAIVLLDDVLSALDGVTEDRVVTRLLGSEGLLRQSTVLLFTHATRHLHLADKIIVLDKIGQIAQEGTYEELKATSGYIKDLLIHPPRYAEAIVEQEIVAKTAAPKPPLAANLNSVRKTGDISVYLYYLQHVGWPAGLVFLLGAAGLAFTRTFPQVWLKFWTEANGADISKYISVYVVLAVGSTAFLTLTYAWILVLVIPRAGLRLHKVMLKVIMAAPISFFARTDTGVTINRFSQDLALIDRQLPTMMALVFMSSFFCIAQAALIATGSSYMGITIPFVLAVVYVVQKVYLRTSRQLRHMDLEERSPLYTHFLETLDGLSTIRSFGWQEESRSTNIQRLDRSQRPYYLLYCIQRWLNLVLDLIVALMAIVVIALATQLRSTTSAGAIGIALNSILGFNTSLSNLIDVWTQMETSLGAIVRIKDFEKNTPSENLPGEDGVPPQEWPSSGAVELRNVTAQYGPGMLALQDVSFKISPGQKVGICGRTGSGKSSLILTLLRLLDLKDGSIFVDGIDLSTLPRELIRSRITAIPQDSFILTGTVRHNVDPFGGIPDEQIIEALQKLTLWPILLERGGLNADMQSQPLSQGQQQLFTLARALLHRSSILLLDEATSNVDGNTDALMQRIIREEFATCTIITVAHRMNSITDADIVVVLENGRVAEVGNPRELLKKRSKFAELDGR
ncbi:putative multidrug resistance protein [Mollisia scopiformis]|uniref:Putative multidrug resistance protein n=1 Tax=Mollisia scopiformis TaxID=149040 RepID=A0A194X6S7_MOLSC|nr:putative multidrug resistance protein [Mollisia scopiformis]KUJ15876.1 putative multidrug resistance protein [Mollisia scopiformis]